MRISQADEQTKKNFLKTNPPYPSTKKYLIAFAIVAILLVSTFAFLQNAAPTPDIVTPITTDTPEPEPSPTEQHAPIVTKPPTPSPSATTTPFSNPWRPPLTLISPEGTAGIIESTENMDNAAWKVIAERAWRYFQPGAGIDPITGLPGAQINWACFTDWDLGGYVQAAIDADKLGLITDVGWTADYRFDKVLTFLETRPLNDYGYPFWFYQAGDGQSYRTISDTASWKYDFVDTGRLFVALNNLKRYKPTFAQRIDDFVYRGRSNYTALLPDILNEATKKNTYAYYITTGFAAFWPTEVGHVPRQILSNIKSLEEIKVNANIGGNITLPKAKILCEPLLHAVFELDIADPSERSYLRNFSRQVYLAHEELHNLTGRWVAFSEGYSGKGTFIYEWVYSPNYGAWAITTIDHNLYPMNPIIYTKVALSFLALYNTKYSRDLCIYLEKCLPSPDSGWSEGADYTESIEGRNILSNVACNTNGMVIAASRHYMQNNP